MKTIDIGAAIDEARLSGLQRLVFVLCFLVSMLDGLDIQVLAFAASKVRAELAISPGQLGLIFSGTLLGAILGAYFGAVADKVGRKWPLVVAVMVFGVFTLACAHAHSFEMLLTFRFLAGLGLGGAVPNMVAMTSEYAPQRLRSSAVTVILWGFPIGALAGGLVAAPILGAFGWRALFEIAAAASLLLGAALIFLLPESIRFLALVRAGDPRLARLFARIRPDLSAAGGAVYSLVEHGPPVGRLSAVFGKELRTGALVLAAAGFTSLLLQYLMTSWTPLLLEARGIPAARAITIGALMNGAGLLGSLFLSRFVGARSTSLFWIGGSFLLGAAAVLTAAIPQESFAAVAITLALFGLFHMGAQIAVTNYAAIYFPTTVRGAGMAWVGAVSRLGSFIGPALGGYLLGLGVSPGRLLAVGAVPGFVTGGLLISLALFERTRRQEPGSGGRPAP
jgi:AAHS family 4-hydroxybenzoate transporter-like MFS transporter